MQTTRARNYHSFSVQQDGGKWRGVEEKLIMLIRVLIGQRFQPHG